MKRILVLSVLVTAALAACGDEPVGAGPVVPPGPVPTGDASVDVATPPPEAGVDARDADSPWVDYPFAVPSGFPKPLVPKSNPVTAEKAALGRHLFYDKRLSGNGTQSCGSCHEQARAFTDGRPRGVGSTGQVHPRNSMSLANMAYAASMTWANPVLLDLESQAPVPMFGIDPVIELGVRGKEAEILARLRGEPKYGPMFAAAFPGQADPYTFDNIVRALATFQRTLMSGRSRYDRYAVDKDATALSDAEKRGLALFGSETLECFHCHGGFNFSDSVAFAGASPSIKFHNTGLYNIDGKGGFPLESLGLVNFTGKASDMGKFKAPTLRNIEVTAPYMHDGSIATLEEVVEHYAAGGRTIPEGQPNAGVGSANPFRDAFIVSFSITTEQKADLVAFLRSLTDSEFLANPAFSNPWPE